MGWTDIGSFGSEIDTPNLDALAQRGVVIFTGRVPLATFREEHPREYDRLVASGELESHLVGPPPRWLSVCAYAFGLSALMVGLTIIAAIVYSIIFR